jgi:CHAD domain-containing protein
MSLICAKNQNISRRSSAVIRSRNDEHQYLSQLTATLKQNLELCAQNPTVDAVHDIRTGTRRIEATLDATLRRHLPAAHPSDGAVPIRDAALRWQRLLKKIRRAAAPVRDLDVHRKLLEKLVQRSANAKASPQAAAPPPTPTEQQAEDLVAWLRHTRHEQAQPLMKIAAKWAARLDAHLAALEPALLASNARRATSRSAAVTALEAFARLAMQMQQLDAGNLHDFRKGAKKARYMAEAGGEDEQAGAVGKALKRLQDEIGDWHDWLVLAEEANRALGPQAVELIALLETQRDQHYALAMKTTERMRGRLMGEWQALSARPRRARAAIS